MPNRSTWLTGAVLAFAFLGLAGCGDSPTVPTAVTTPPRTPTPVTITVAEGSYTGLEPGRGLAVSFQTNVLGDLDTAVDWTFATNNLDVVLARGINTCVTPANEVDFSLCTVVANEVSPTMKPERMRAAGLAAGAYTLYIGNFGTTNESLSYQSLLTYTPSASEPGGNVFGLPSGAPQPSLLPVRAWR